MSVVDRAFELAATVWPRAPRDRLAHPFGFAAHPAYRWRLSRDVYEAFGDEVGINVPRHPTLDLRLLGEPLTVDDGLPPDSMLLLLDAPR